MANDMFAGKWAFFTPTHLSAPNGMTQDEFAGKWPHIRGQARTWWDKLDDDDLNHANGQFEPFIDLLQAKYGYTREHAEKEITKRIAEYEAQEINKRMAEYEAHPNSKPGAG